MATVLFDIENTVHNNLQQSSTSKECNWTRRAKPNEKSCFLDNLKISKAEYGKTDKETLKPTAFDPRSTELDLVSFMDQLKAGLQQHASSAVILQILPQVPVEVTEQEITEIDKCLDHEEEVVAVEVNTISELRDAFLLSKGLDCSKTFDVTEEICHEFLSFIKIDQYQADMIFEKTKLQGNCDFWKEQRCGRITGSNFYKICHLKESTNPDNALKDLLGYCPLPPERQPIQFAWGHEKEESAVDFYCKKLKKVNKEMHVVESGLIIDPEFSHLCSSPDRIRVCQCCGKRVVE